MNRLVKTKAKRKYSLGKRILAGVLSIAMIGSVSYVGNYVSKKSAKADPDTEVASSAAEYDITRYVYNLFEHEEAGSYYLNKDAKSSYTIYVPAKAEIVQTLGTGNGYNDAKVHVYQDDSGNYYFNAGDTPATEVVANVGLTNNAPEIGSWDTENQKYTGDATTGEIKYTIGISYTNPTDNNVISSFQDNKNVSEITVHIVPQRYSSVVVTRNDNGTISLSDDKCEKNDTGNGIYYYGNCEYILRDKTSAPTSVLPLAEGTLEVLNNYLETNTLKPGNYSVAKVINDVEIGNKGITESETPFTIRQPIVRTINGSAATKTAGAYSFTANGQAPNAAVSIPFETDIPLTKGDGGNVVVTKTSEAGVAVSQATDLEVGTNQNASGLYANTLTIPAATDPNSVNGKTATYSIAITDTVEKITETIKATVVYSNGTPGISSFELTAGDTGKSLKTAGTTTYYNGSALSATATYTLPSGVTVEKEGTTLNYKVGDGVATAITTSVDETNSKVTGTYSNLEDGSTYVFDASIKSSYGISKKASEVTPDALSKIVTIDTTAPAISSITASQGETSATLTRNENSTAYVTETKVTRQKDLVLNVALSEAGSGIDESTVAIKNGETTISGAPKDAGSYQFTIPKDTNIVDGTALSLTLTASDTAGNSMSMPLTIPVYKEKATIRFTGTTPEYLESVLETDPIFIKTSELSANDDKLKLTYSIESEVPIADANQISVSGTTSLTFAKELKTETPTTSGVNKYKLTLTSDKVSGTQDISGLTVKTTNQNGYSTTSTSISIIRLDLTKPKGNQGISTETGYAAVKKTTDWYQLLYVLVTADDGEKGAGVDTSGKTAPASIKATGAKWVANTSNGVVYKVDNSASSTGTDISFSITDKVGNVSDPVTGNYKVDDEPPTIDTFTIETLADGVSAYKTAPKFSATEVKDNISVAKVSLFVKKTSDNSVQEVPITLKDGAFTDVQPVFTATDGSQDGVYTYWLEVTDQAGNVMSTAADAKTFTYDTTKPKITIGTLTNTDPATGTTYKKVSVPITVNDTNIALGNIVVKDNGVVVANEDPRLSWTQTTTGYEGTYTTSTQDITVDGDHRITVDARDNATNAADQESTTFNLDQTAPVIKATIGGTATIANGDEKHVTGTPDFAFTIDSAQEPHDDSAKDVFKYTYTPFVGTPTENTVTGARKFNLASEGTYAISVSVTDAAGNPATATYTVVVNNKPPVLTAVLDPSVSSQTVDGTIYYKDAAKVNLSVEGNDLADSSSFVVKDNGNQIDNAEVVWADDGTGKQTATVQIELPDTDEATASHTVTLDASNKSGIAGTQASVSFVLDSRDPDITTKLNDEVYEDTDKRVAGAVSLSASNDDANAYGISGTVTRKDFNGNVVSTTAVGPATDYKNISYSIPAGEENNGIYTFDVSAKDKAGHTNTKSFTFVVDNTAPVVEIIPEINFKLVEGYYQETVILDLGITDDDINTDTFVVKDGDRVISPDSEWVQNGNKYTNKVTIALPDEAKETESHSITVSCVDKTNNPGTKSFDFVLDSKNPVVTAIIRDSVYTSSENTSFKNSDNKDGGTTKVYSVEDEANKYSYTATYNFTSFDPNVASVTGGVINNPAVFEAANDGKYEITYVATDKSGRVNDEKTKTITFIVDNKNPELTLDFITTPSSKDSRYYNDAVAMSYSAADSDMKSYTLTDNGVVVASGNAGVSSSYTIIKQASFEGSHKVVLTSTDNSGNTSSKTLEFYMDFTAPSMSAVLNGSSISSNNAGRYLQADGTITTAVTDNLGNDTTDITRTVVMTKPDKTSTTTTNKIGAGSETFTTEADYVVTYTAVDLAGNSSTFGPINFRVDKTAPALKITGVNGTANHDVTVSFGMEEAFYWDIKNATVKVYKKIDGQSESLLRTVDFKASGLNSTMSETFTEDGEYRFEFTAEDMAGNTANANYTFIMDKNAPLITLSVENYAKTKDPVDFGVNLIEGFYTSNKVTLSGTRTDVDGKKTDVKFDDYNFKSQRESNFLQQFKEDGIYDITVTAVDAAGNKSEKSVHFTIDKTAPEIGDLSKYDGTTVNKFEFDMNNADLYKDLTTCDITVYLDGIEWDGSSALDDGSHVLKVVATDELGNSSEKEVTFLLDTKAPTILVTGIKDGDRIEDPTTITVTVQLDSDKLTNVQLNGQLIEIKDNKAEIVVNKKGDYKLTATAEDEAGNESSIEMNFAYGAQFNFVLLIIIVAAALVLGAVGFFLVKGKKKSE